MRWRREPSGNTVQLAAAVAACLVCGALVLASGLLAAAGEARPARPSALTGLRDVLHSPPLFAHQGEALTLRYEVVCQVDDLGEPCPVSGKLFVRPSGGRSFEELALRRAGESALSTTLPASLTDGPGLAYYAVIADGLGGRASVPAGGARAPQQVWTTDELVTVELGQHAFGRARAPDRSVARAPWGDRLGAAGLITGNELVRIGPSAFDVAPDGSIVLLDQVNDRLSTYRSPGGTPRHVPIPFAGAEGDLAVAGDGSIHVLDHGAETVVRSFAPGGTAMAPVRIDGRGADMLRATPAGPALHGYPGDVWFPLRRGAAPLGAAEQATGARPGRPVAGGLDVVVRGNQREATFALVAGDRVVRGWRITSATPLGEIQLAEPFAGGLVVVLRMWTEADAEFAALVLSTSGLARSFSVDAVEWAESAALSRFRLHGQTLYQLRSAPSGVEIVTFDLGGTR